MPFDDDLIRRVRESTDIVEIASEYVSLKKRGAANWFGLSPFKEEKTPSFSVHETRQIFHDFSTGEGGNVYTLLMKLEGISFPEAVRRLAERAHIKIEDDRGRQGGGENDAIYRANDLAAKFYRHHLTIHDGADSRFAREYLEQRGIGEELQETFKIGLAPPEWDGLLTVARRRKHKDYILEKAGLVRRSERKGTYYDYFRGRLMFPIMNASGQVVAFGGRILRDDPDRPQPKYINSPETPVYHKGKLVYGLTQARGAMRQKGAAVFVEGYTDVIAMHGGGFNHVVAGLGTALTAEQAGLVKRFAKRVILLYDADTAGAIAANRGADVLAEAGLDVRVALLAPGEDPDTFLKHQGPEAMEQALDNALPLVDFKVDYFRRQGALESAQGRSAAARAILDTLTRIDDDITRQLALKEAAIKLGVEERTLARELNRQRGGRSGSARQISADERKPVSEKERLLQGMLWALVRFPERRSEVFNFFRSADLCEHPLRPVFQMIEAAHIEGDPIREADLYNQFAEQDHLVRLIGQALNREGPRHKDARQVEKWETETFEGILHDAAAIMRMEEIRRELDDLRQQRQRGETGDEMANMRRRQELKKELKQLEIKRAKTHLTQRPGG